METRQSFRDYVQQGGYYRYEGRDPDPSAKRFTAALGLASIIAPWATYALVDPDVGTIAAIEGIATRVYFAYGAAAIIMSLLVFGRSLFFVCAKAVFAALAPLGIIEAVFNHSDFLAPFYNEVISLSYHRIGILLLLGAYAAFLYDLVRNGAADIISRAIWKKDGDIPPPAPRPAKKEVETKE